MKPPILILRTLSVEKLSPVLDACRARWPEHPLIVVTSPGRAAELLSDSRIADVISSATGPEGFAAPLQFDQKLTAVVVPVANANGSGYANAMQACGNLLVAERYLASYSRTLHRLSPLAWAFRWRVESMLETPVRWVGRIWAGRLLSRKAN